MNDYLLLDIGKGLSIQAKAAAYAIAATVAHNGDPIWSERMIMLLLELTREEWVPICEELKSVGRIETQDGCEWMRLEGGEDLLRLAVGPAGRPSTKDWAELRDDTLSTFGAKCAYCGADDEPLAIDHIHPIALGGSNHLCNLVPACKGCNSAKGGREWEAWVPIMERRRAARRARLVEG